MSDFQFIMILIGGIGTVFGVFVGFLKHLKSNKFDQKTIDEIKKDVHENVNNIQKALDSLDKRADKSEIDIAVIKNEIHNTLKEKFNTLNVEIGSIKSKLDRLLDDLEKEFTKRGM